VSDFDTLWLEDAGYRAQAIGVAARALRDNPSNLAVSDNPYVRVERGYSIFGRLMHNGSVAPAGAKRGECVLGVAAFQAPGGCVAYLLPPEMRRLTPPPPDASDLERWLHNGSIMAAHDLPEPHVHVGPVGVEPGFQGRGIGRAVMRHLCDRLDERGEVGWLETDKPENVAFYVSLGFEVTDETEVLGRFRWWFMRRAAR
jgi:ribosomal protein S18 acetylase RimI-like enzyme